MALTTPDSFRIRRAARRDTPGILRCLHAAFEKYRERYTPEAFADTVLTRDALQERFRKMFIYVAVTRRGKIIGTVAAAIADGQGHLRGMAVHPDFQKRGVAARLLERSLGDLGARHCRRVTLDTTRPLRTAARFYEGKGFRRTRRVSDFFGMPLYEYAKVLRRKRRKTR
jgi:N-acetylglutamate synthase-like GNAT family acetyltransferase